LVQGGGGGTAVLATSLGALGDLTAARLCSFGAGSTLAVAGGADGADVSGVVTGAERGITPVITAAVTAPIANTDPATTAMTVFFLPAKSAMDDYLLSENSEHL